MPTLLKTTTIALFLGLLSIESVRAETDSNLFSLDEDSLIIDPHHKTLEKETESQEVKEEPIKKGRKFDFTKDAGDILKIMQKI
jgi:hypothetical protein